MKGLLKLALLGIGLYLFVVGLKVTPKIMASRASNSLTKPDQSAQTIEPPQSKPNPLPSPSSPVPVESPKVGEFQDPVITATDQPVFSGASVAVPPIQQQNPIDRSNPVYSEGLRVYLAPELPGFDGWNVRRDPCISQTCLNNPPYIARNTDEVRLLDNRISWDSSGQGWYKIRVIYADGSNVVGYIHQTGIKFY